MLRKLGLNSQTFALLAALFLVLLGEELWGPYLPKYLDALGASLLVIGLWSAGKNLLEGFLFLGGGELSNRIGTRGTLALIGFVPLLGYIVFLTTHSVPAAIVASFLVSSWEALSMGSAAITPWICALRHAASISSSLAPGRA